MGINAKWDISKAQQVKAIKALTAELAPLRAKVGISQGELSKLVGISRQTYSTIECGNRMMSWNTFLSLLLFYDYNSLTHQIIRDIGAFPEELMELFNNGEPNLKTEGIAGIPRSITDKLDEAAYRSIRTVIMLEYARCANIPGDAVVKSFDGIDFTAPEENERAADALREIKESRKHR